MHFNPYFSRGYSTAKVAIKMHARSLCFISAACTVLFTAVPTNIKNYHWYLPYVQDYFSKCSNFISV